MLRTKKATTHPDLTRLLQHVAREVSPDRIVDEGVIITAGGVTPAIDPCLYRCEKIAGKEARERIQRQMGYRQYSAV